MEPKEKRPKIQGKAERLAKRREQRRRRLLQETADEREARLEKHRKACKKRTVEAEGKQKEYHREYDFRRLQEETKEERAERLENIRQRRASETAEVRAKRLEKLNMYFQKAVANESEQEREHRLAKKRHTAKENRSSIDATGLETNGVSVSRCVHVALEETVSGLDIGVESECVHEAIGGNVCGVEAEDASVSVPEEGEESGSVPEPQGVSKNEYLHEGGWQNADSPLHEQEFVQNEMHSFHLDQEHLEHRQCTVCKEAWPTRQNLRSETYTCYRCKRDKKSPKKFSAENDMDPGIVPEQLKCL